MIFFFLVNKYVYIPTCLCQPGVASCWLVRILTKTAGKWQKCNLVSGYGLCGQRHGLVMNWVDHPRTSADERDVVWAPRCRDCVWAVAGFRRFFIDLSFLREQSPWSFSGLDSCMLPPIFLQLRKGSLWNCVELLQSDALCCIDQCGTGKPRPPKMHGPRTVLGYVGKRGWGVKGYWCLRKWVQWIFLQWVLHALLNRCFGH